MHNWAVKVSWHYVICYHVWIIAKPLISPRQHLLINYCILPCVTSSASPGTPLTSSASPSSVLFLFKLSFYNGFCFSKLNVFGLIADYGITLKLPYR